MQSPAQRQAWTRRAPMVQSASHTTSKAQRHVAAATTRATAMIPIVIVQTPVCDRLGLDGEMVGKRARILIRQITVGCASSPPSLAHRNDPAGVQLMSRVSLLSAASGSDGWPDGIPKRVLRRQDARLMTHVLEAAWQDVACGTYKGRRHPVDLLFARVRSRARRVIAAATNWAARKQYWSWDPSRESHVCCRIAEPRICES
jgi:hypothetical protein